MIRGPAGLLTLPAGPFLLRSHLSGELGDETQFRLRRAPYLLRIGFYCLYDIKEAGIGTRIERVLSVPQKRKLTDEKEKVSSARGVKKNVESTNVNPQPVGDETNPGQKLLVRFHVIERSFDLASLIVKFLGGAGLLYFGIVRPLELTAGKQTGVNFVYTAVLDMKLHMIVPWAAAAIFGGLWHRERNQRKTTVAREHKRLQDLESRLDPERTSSGLTTMGDDPERRS